MLLRRPVTILRLPQLVTTLPISRTGFSQPLVRRAAAAPLRLRSPIVPRRDFHWSRVRWSEAAKEAGHESKSQKAKDSAKKAGNSLKDLAKKYGWAAVGVYLGLSAIDLPLCFLFVHSAGQERITRWEIAVREFFNMSTDQEDLKTAPKPGADSGDGGNGSSLNWNLLVAEFTVAYIIHKTVFIFVRIPLTAAITPAIVKKLRSWGFNIGKSVDSSMKSLGTPARNNKKWWWFF